MARESVPPAPAASLPTLPSSPAMHGTTRRLAAAVVAAALIATAAGCGDDSEQLDAAELASQGDELCRQGQERFAKVQDSELVNAKDAVQQTGELLDVASDELDELRSLQPPDELRADYDAYLAARAAALELLEKGRDAAAERDAAGYSKAQSEVEAGAAERRRLAQAVGFEICSQASKGG